MEHAQSEKYHSFKININVIFSVKNLCYSNVELVVFMFDQKHL